VDIETIEVWEEVARGAMQRAVRSESGRSKLLGDLAKRAEGRATAHTNTRGRFRSVEKPRPGSDPRFWDSQPTYGNLLENLWSDSISASRWRKVDNRGRPLRSTPARYILSIYDLHTIVRAFETSLPDYIATLRREENDRAATKGNPALRYAARILNATLDPFAASFQSRQIKFSRYGAISCFIGALYGKYYDSRVYEPRRVHGWCRPRRG
jgi:hypothetical protein